MKGWPKRVLAETLGPAFSPFFINLLACSPCEEQNVIFLEYGAKYFKNISIKSSGSIQIYLWNDVLY